VNAASVFCSVSPIPGNGASSWHEFAHHGTYILAPECLRSIKPSLQHPDSIYAILSGLGASDTCHLISEDSNLDGEDMELLEALKQIVGCGMGTIISCLRDWSDISRVN